MKLCNSDNHYNHNINLCSVDFRVFITFDTAAFYFKLVVFFFLYFLLIFVWNEEFHINHRHT